ncbi:MAG: YchF/TatD family DNA exonuclease [Bacteroidota bacterium]|nr:YchF/TatD family DNA exonuclease [Bacteroidota bacterium]
MFIDTHCHLFFPNFETDLDEVIDRAKNNGIDYIIVPATDIATAYKVTELASKYDFIYGAVGVHPQDCKNWDDSILKVIDELSNEKKIVAIGEIGLDYYYDYSPKETQKIAFKQQLDLAISKDLPVIIHNRDADIDMMNTIRLYNSNLKAQFHCFNGSLQDAKELIEMGHYISFTGNITFKKADALRSIVSSIDINNILIETDSPFMTPEPNRGKRNEPANVKIVANQIASTKSIPVEDVGRITSFNAFKLFGIGAKNETCFVYQLGNSLYINVTNRCNANCVFCDRKGEASLHGYNLKMNKQQEPAADVYIKAIGDPKAYEEIVFCGYGEPTIRWNIVKEVAAYVKQNGGKTRINTNGHGNVVNKRDITPEFSGIIDSVSISLNSPDIGQYAELMRVNKEMFNEMITFARKAKAYVNNVVLTVVSLDSVEIEKAREFAENVVGVNFRVRKLF